MAFTPVSTWELGDTAPAQAAGHSAGPAWHGDVLSKEGSQSAKSPAVASW
jgi:hypothetical protein